MSSNKYIKKIVVGILAHVDSGKTTLSEAFMYLSGKISKLGRVDHGSSFLDNNSIERERGITIFSKQAVFSYNDTFFTLLDTPGHIDFSAETERTLQVLDYAVLVISGTDGVQSHTHTLYRLLKKYNIPCFIFVNKLDISESKSKIFRDIKEKLDDKAVDFTYTSTNDFYENIALCSDELLEKYDSDGIIEKSDIIKHIQKRNIVPCMFGSALKLDGVDKFLEKLCEYTVMPQYSSDFGAIVYKISEDDQKNRLTFMKITGGTINVKDVLANGEKIDQIRIYSGEKYTQATQATAGTICAVTGISSLKSGDGLGKEKNSDIPVLAPVLTYCVTSDDGTDLFNLLEKLKILEDEDPQLKISYNEITKDIQVRIMGEVQLQILHKIIAERFGINVKFGEGNIIYKETISKSAEGVGHFEPLRHYAEVHLLLKPGKRGSGVVISSECREDILNKNWQRLIITHLYEKTHIGLLTGSPLTDIEIILVSGKAHPKHTEGGDFRQATYRAVRHGLHYAEPVLLEPIYEFMLEIPTENVGRAMSDIQKMNGNFDSPYQVGDFSVLKGTAPVFEMNGYSKEVVSYTHGLGRLSYNLKGYEPCHNADEIIEKFAYKAETDTENPADSVFCSHGAGHIVKWCDVYDNMHLASITQKKSAEPKAWLKECVTQKDVFALDKELMQIFERTYGAVKKRNTANVGGKRVSYDNENSSYKRGNGVLYDGDEYVLVDGYNVIFAWDELSDIARNVSLESARHRLINIMCNYQGYKKCRLILVFDAYKVKGSTGNAEKIDGITVIYTKEAETADSYIEKASYKLAKNNRVRVVTSDGMEQMIILGNGALRVSSRMFLEEVRNAQEEIKELITERNQ